MLETLAMILCAIWVVGLVSGNAFGGLIHIFLVSALAAFFVHHRAASKTKSIAQADSARNMSRVMGTPTVETKSRPGRGSTSAAA